MEMSIEGLENLMAKLRRLGGSVDAAMNKGLGRGAQKIKRDAKKNCPYDTARLKNSIECTNQKFHSFSYADNKKNEYTGSVSGGGFKCWVVGTNVEYAMFVEFGTGQLGAPGVPHTMQPWTWRDADGNYHTTYGAPPRPYLYPALLSNREYVFKMCQSELRKAIRSAMA